MISGSFYRMGGKGKFTLEGIEGVVVYGQGDREVCIEDGNCNHNVSEAGRRDSVVRYVMVVVVYSV